MDSVMDIQILEIMLELCEDENKDLKAEIDTLYDYIGYLEKKNSNLIKEYNHLIDIKKRYN
jgi:predicted RNase H-like nuclease (RuvC/YqgF family)